MSTVTDDSLLTALEEVESLHGRNTDPAVLLSNLVMHVGNRFETDVCSIYLLDPIEEELVLAATVGLRQSAIGRVRMALNEGLVGLVAEQLQPVAVRESADHPRFKYFAMAGEDPFHSFLGVPLMNGEDLEGVLVVQTCEAREFSSEEIEMLTLAGEQIGPIVSAIDRAG